MLAPEDKGRAGENDAPDGVRHYDTIEFMLRVASDRQLKLV